MAVDFKRGTDLFLSSEKELAAALGLRPEEVRAYRQNPGKVPPEILAKLGKVLIERGNGMRRVGELIADAAGGFPRRKMH